MIEKKRLTKLGKAEIMIGIIFGFLAVGVSIYVYVAGVMDIDFVNIIRIEIEEFKAKLPF